MRVSIGNEHGVSALSVFQDCTLEIFFGALPDQLSPYPYGGVCFIVEIDWLSRFGAMIDCEGQ